MRISDWSSDVCSSDLLGQHRRPPQRRAATIEGIGEAGEAGKLSCSHDSLLPFALSLSKGRSFFFRWRKKDGVSTSSARTEIRKHAVTPAIDPPAPADRKSTSLNSSH